MGSFFPETNKEFMFRGQFTYSIDQKGRLSIPAKLRKSMDPEAGDTFMMVKGAAKNIDVYPKPEWLEREKKLQNLDRNKKKEAYVVRRIMHSLAEDTLDSQNRILIPKHLKEHAEIDKEVLIIGEFEKLELWNPDIFNEYMDNPDFEQSDPIADVMEEVLSEKDK